MATKKTATQNTRAKKTAPRTRATNEEMQRRADEVISALAASNQPLTIEQVQRKLKLNYASTNSLLRHMTAQGRIESAGRVGRNLTFRPSASSTEAVQDDEVQEADEATEVVAETMRAIPMQKVVTQLLLGTQVEVVGLHLQDDETVIDLRSPEGTILSVKAVTGS